MNRLKLTETETVARLLSLVDEKKEWLQKMDVAYKDIKQRKQAFDENHDPDYDKFFVVYFDSYALDHAQKENLRVTKLIDFIKDYGKQEGYDLAVVYEQLEKLKPLEEECKHMVRLASYPSDGFEGSVELYV